MSVPCIRVAILDLYNRAPNEGMRCIQSILANYATQNQLPVDYQIFEVRYANEIPKAADFDVYISTGGPGSPFDGEGLAWEKSYFDLIDELWSHNQQQHHRKKHLFAICHSFQMLCRHFKLGEVTRRKSTSFGTFPVHETEQGRSEVVFEGLADPFFAVDSRDWQVIQPKQSQLYKLGASVLAIEKERPHVFLERAVMAIRLSDEFIGTQFHPEADAQGMSMYFRQPEKKRYILDTYGEDKYEEMLRSLNDPQKIAMTQQTIIPAFLKVAVQALHEA
jgi:GMP synthase-like glutamine amidotransferase